MTKMIMVKPNDVIKVGQFIKSLFSKVIGPSGRSIAIPIPGNVKLTNDGLRIAAAFAPTPHDKLTYYQASLIHAALNGVKEVGKITGDNTSSTGFLTGALLEQMGGVLEHPGHTEVLNSAILRMWQGQKTLLRELVNDFIEQYSKNALDGKQAEALRRELLRNALRGNEDLVDILSELDPRGRTIIRFGKQKERVLLQKHTGIYLPVYHPVSNRVVFTTKANRILVVGDQNDFKQTLNHYVNDQLSTPLPVILLLPAVASNNHWISEQDASYLFWNYNILVAFVKSLPGLPYWSILQHLSQNSITRIPAQFQPIADNTRSRSIPVLFNKTLLNKPNTSDITVSLSPQALFLDYGDGNMDIYQALLSLFPIPEVATSEEKRVYLDRKRTFYPVANEVIVSDNTVNAGLTAQLIEDGVKSMEFLLENPHVLPGATILVYLAHYLRNAVIREANKSNFQLNFKLDKTQSLPYLLSEALLDEFEVLLKNAGVKISQASKMLSVTPEDYQAKALEPEQQILQDISLWRAFIERRNMSSHVPELCVGNRNVPKRARTVINKTVHNTSPEQSWSVKQNNSHDNRQPETYPARTTQEINESDTGDAEKNADTHQSCVRSLYITTDKYGNSKLYAPKFGSGYGLAISAENLKLSVCQAVSIALATAGVYHVYPAPSDAQLQVAEDIDRR